MQGHAPDRPLDAAQEELRKFNAKRRWKSAILTVVATNRLKTIMDMKKLREEKPRKAKKNNFSKTSEPDRLDDKVAFFHSCWFFQGVRKNFDKNCCKTNGTSKKKKTLFQTIRA